MKARIDREKSRSRVAAANFARVKGLVEACCDYALQDFAGSIIFTRAVYARCPELVSQVEIPEHVRAVLAREGRTCGEEGAAGFAGYECLSPHFEQWLLREAEEKYRKEVAAAAARAKVVDIMEFLKVSSRGRSRSWDEEEPASARPGKNER